MKLKIIIADNGFKAHKPFIIKSFEKNNSFEEKVIYNFNDNIEFNTLEKIFNKLRIPLDTTSFNQRIIDAVKDFNPDIVFIIKGNNVFKKTLKKIKKIDHRIKIISWSADNMIKKHNTSFYFDISISSYDIHFTTKSNIIDSLYSKGAKKVIFLNKAYSKYDHYPLKYNKDYDFNVLFIGSAEKNRYESMKKIAQKGIEVNIFGNMWTREYKSIKHLIIHRNPLLGDEYRNAISSSKISLCFLRKINDDLQTDRTMEIPACRGFMLAERTKEHENLFKENEEAEFFSSDEELVQKTLYYLSNKKQIDKIKNKGYERVLKSNYSFDDMVNKIKSHLK
tara:strand:+ start:1554 stop:2561 length:1008 start_codon:yes stop_codon:yes gene_type:complete